MAENEIVVEPEAAQTEPETSKLTKFTAGVKEWFRKFIVKLKRRPMNIAFCFLIISSLVYMLLLSNFAQTGLEYAPTGVPISIFVNMLFSILVLMLFLNSFPKREKKPKLVMLILLFVFMAVMIGLDILLFVQWNNAWNEALQILSPSDRALREVYIYGAIYGALAHAILVAVAAILTATYPLYGKLIMKINTKKVVESTEMKEAIDTSEED